MMEGPETVPERSASRRASTTTSATRNSELSPFDFFQKGPQVVGEASAPHEFGMCIPRVRHVHTMLVHPTGCVRAKHAFALSMACILHALKQIDWARHNVTRKLCTN
eukprot:1161316-Pelagomonas_calceolata.AAC.4